MNSWRILDIFWNCKKFFFSIFLFFLFEKFVSKSFRNPNEVQKKFKNFSFKKNWKITEFLLLDIIEIFENSQKSKENGIESIYKFCFNFFSDFWIKKLFFIFLESKEFQKISRFFLKENNEILQFFENLKIWNWKTEMFF